MNVPMYLKLFISPDSDSDIKEKYVEAVEKHNEKAASSHPDAGFDLFCPISEIVQSKTSIWVDMQVKAAAFTHDEPTNLPFEYAPMARPVSYYMYPRSSISKTPLRLSNSVGVIDSGYRGNLITALYHSGVVSEKFGENYHINKFDRLVQICSPTLGPVFVKIVDTEEELGSTERGAGGFGSSGK